MPQFDSDLWLRAEGQSSPVLSHAGNPCVLIFDHPPRFSRALLIQTGLDQEIACRHEKAGFPEAWRSNP